MQTENTPLYVFNTHVEAEHAIQSLNRSGFDVKKLSLVGKGYHSEEHSARVRSILAQSNLSEAA
jgi:hypothetical protein